MVLEMTGFSAGRPYKRNLTLDSELMTVKTNKEMSMTEHVLCGSGEIETK